MGEAVGPSSSTGCTSGRWFRFRTPWCGRSSWSGKERSTGCESSPDRRDVGAAMAVDAGETGGNDVQAGDTPAAGRRWAAGDPVRKDGSQRGKQPACAHLLESGSGPGTHDRDHHPRRLRELLAWDLPVPDDLLVVGTDTMDDRYTSTWVAGPHVCPQVKGIDDTDIMSNKLRLAEIAGWL